jgi:hypothetical protein
MYIFDISHITVHKKLLGFHFMYLQNIFDNVQYLRLTGLRESKLGAVHLPLGGCDPDDNTGPVCRRQAVHMAPVAELAPAGAQPHCPGHLKALSQKFFYNNNKRNRKTGLVMWYL